LLSIGIRACAHNAGHSFAKAFPDGRFIACAAILDDIVEQPGDSLVFIATMFKHQSRNRHEMGNIGNRRALAYLPGVRGGCKVERLGQTLVIHPVLPQISSRL
jgi:hypothetical protein